MDEDRPNARFCRVPPRARLDERLAVGDYRMLLEMTYRAGPDGRLMLNQGRLADEWGQHRSSLTRTISRLVTFGYVRRLGKVNGSRGANWFEVVGDDDADEVEFEAADRGRPVTLDVTGQAPPVTLDVTGTGNTGVTGQGRPVTLDVTGTGNISGYHEQPIGTAQKDSFPSPRASEPRKAEAALAALERCLGETTFRAWFAQAELRPPSGDGPSVLAVPSRFVADRIRQDFSGKLEELLGRRVEVVVSENARRA